MKIDVHRHSKDKGSADKYLRNLFHDEIDEISSGGAYSVGLHPWHVNEQSLIADVNSIKEIAALNSVFAIGEAGIDKSKDINIEIQKQAFEMQVDVAKSVNKPMVIHCVRAYDVLQSYRKKNLMMKPWLFHWFNGSIQMAESLITMNCFLSFGLVLFKENSKAFKTFMEMPSERILLETDDANITIEQVYNRAADLRGMNGGEWEKIVENNFNACFGVRL